MPFFNHAGFSEAIRTVFPKTEIQLCVIHQLRNNLKYVPHKDRKAVIADLKGIYQALTIEEAELGLEILKDNWNKKYPLISQSGRIIGKNLPYTLNIHMNLEN